MSLSNCGNGFITCPHHIEGRIDGYQNKVLKCLHEFDCNDNYISYFEGVASIRAFLDVRDDMLSDITNWPQQAINKYNEYYQEHKVYLKE